MGTGTLQSLTWLKVGDKKVCCEIVIDLDQITCAIEHVDDTGGKTCLVLLRNKQSFHLDVSLNEMRRIIKIHRDDPDMEIDTHPNTFCIPENDENDFDEDEYDGEYVAHGILRSLTWLSINDQKECREIVMDLDQIICATENADATGDGTCTVWLDSQQTYHLDVPLKTMRNIMKEHKISPEKDFNTHPHYYDVDDDETPLYLPE